VVISSLPSTFFPRLFFFFPSIVEKVIRLLLFWTPIELPLSRDSFKDSLYSSLLIKLKALYRTHLFFCNEPPISCLVLTFPPGSPFLPSQSLSRISSKKPEGFPFPPFVFSPLGLLLWSKIIFLLPAERPTPFFFVLSIFPLL